MPMSACAQNFIKEGFPVKGPSINDVISEGRRGFGSAQRPYIREMTHSALNL